MCMHTVCDSARIRVRHCRKRGGGGGGGGGGEEGIENIDANERAVDFVEC